MLHRRGKARVYDLGRRLPAQEGSLVVRTGRTPCIWLFLQATAVVQSAFRVMLECIGMGASCTCGDATGKRC